MQQSAHHFDIQHAGIADPASTFSPAIGIYGLLEPLASASVQVIIATWHYNHSQLNTLMLVQRTTKLLPVFQMAYKWVCELIMLVFTIAVQDCNCSRRPVCTASNENMLVDIS